MIKAQNILGALVLWRFRLWACTVVHQGPTYCFETEFQPDVKYDIFEIISDMSPNSEILPD